MCVGVLASLFSFLSWFDLLFGAFQCAEVFYFRACYEDTLEDFVIYEVTKLMDMGVQEKE